MNAIRKRPKLRKTVATGLFIFGTVALALPLLPGWLMIGAGLYFLSIDSPVTQGHIARYRAKFRYFDYALRYSYDKLHKEKEPEIAIMPAIIEKA